jgi:Mg2+ and Co2+ transporter CorA
MDLNQLSQLASYLDAERRKDKTVIAQLQERVESLSREVEARSRYAANLESTLAELKTQVTRAMGWTAAIDSVRAEFNQTVEREQDQRGKSERELIRTRQIEIESIVRQLNEIKKEVKPYGRYAEEIGARQTEEARLADLIGRVQVQLLELERRFDAPTATLTYLEEQRRQDVKRITAIEQQTPDILKRVEAFAPRLILLDDAIRKKHTEIEEAARQIEAQKQVIEAQRVADLRRERQFAEYAELIERMKTRAEEIQTQVVGYYQMRDEVKRELSGLPDFKEQVEVRVNEVAELQRDAEERAKRAASTFRDEMDKVWKTFSVGQEEKWHERDRRIAEMLARIAEVEEDVIAIAAQAPPLYPLLEEFARHYAETGREWLARSNQLLDQAKLNLAPDNKLSRRQRRKLQTQAGLGEPANSPANGAAQAIPTTPVDDIDDVDMDADLVR